MTPTMDEDKLTEAEKPTFNDSVGTAAIITVVLCVCVAIGVLFWIVPIIFLPVGIVVVLAVVIHAIRWAFYRYSALSSASTGKGE
jgi:hypothetical protein